MTLVFQALEKANMELHPEKCVFHVKEVEFFGYILTQGGIKIDSAKVKTVQEWPILRTVTEIQEWLIPKTVIEI